MDQVSVQIVGDSPAIRALGERIPVVASARRTTLISGPTGSGKEVVAAALHAARDSAAPYVAVHCAALPEPLLEAELFGHTRGAFTGATQARAGLIRTACGGTLFLDEVDSLSASAQAKLLRFLESGEYRPVGADRLERADVWVIAATNKSLVECVQRGSFREDLYYRLDVMHLHLPPLCRRGRDIELLATYFLERSARSRSLQFSPSAIAAMRSYGWPGNVRELKHRIERAVVNARGTAIEPRDLELDCEVEPARGQSTNVEQVWTHLWRLVEADGLSLSEVMAVCERRLIEAALHAERDNRTRAARRLGIHVRTMFKKLRE